MKKKALKLTLNRETLRLLDPDYLAMARGGTDQDTNLCGTYTCYGQECQTQGCITRPSDCTGC